MLYGHHVCGAAARRGAAPSSVVRSLNSFATAEVAHAGQLTSLGHSSPSPPLAVMPPAAPRDRREDRENLAELLWRRRQREEMAHLMKFAAYSLMAAYVLAVVKVFWFNDACSDTVFTLSTAALVTVAYNIERWWVHEGRAAWANAPPNLGLEREQIVALQLVAAGAVAATAVLWGLVQWLWPATGPPLWRLVFGAGSDPSDEVVARRTQIPELTAAS